MAEEKKPGNRYELIINLTASGVTEYQKAIGTRSGIKPFLPTEMTRCCPFHPFSKKDKRCSSNTVDSQIIGNIRHETSWGFIQFDGHWLSIRDEELIYTLLRLMKANKSIFIETTYYQLCNYMGKPLASQSYNVIKASLTRLALSSFTINTDKSNQKFHSISHYLSYYVDEEKGTLMITIDPFFGAIYMAGGITHLDHKIHNAIRGDIAKAVYRFLTSHYLFVSGKEYRIKLSTLSTAINLSHKKKSETRKAIKRALKALVDVGHIEEDWAIDKFDTVKVKKSFQKLQEEAEEKAVSAPQNAHAGVLKIAKVWTEKTGQDKFTIRDWGNFKRCFFDICKKIPEKYKGKVMATEHGLGYRKVKYPAQFITDIIEAIELDINNRGWSEVSDISSANTGWLCSNKMWNRLDYFYKFHRLWTA